jgi:hypothetical protein
MRSFQTIGVAPLRLGTGSFQAMFSVADHLTGKFFSPLAPFSEGPRHCGQLSADTTTTAQADIAIAINTRFMPTLLLFPPC